MIRLKRSSSSNKTLLITNVLFICLLIGISLKLKANDKDSRVESFQVNDEKQLKKSDLFLAISKVSRMFEEPTLRPISTHCDPCKYESCLKTQLERDLFPMVRQLCAFGPSLKAHPEQYMANPQKMAFVTMLEPPSKGKGNTVLENVIELLQSVDEHYRYHADYFFFVDNVLDLELLMIQRVTHRKLTFIDVTSEFRKPPPSHPMMAKYHARNRCEGDFSYRAMCRFASGPLYWIKFLDPYDYIVRLDEDARLTRRVPTNIVSDLVDINGAYGYVLEQPSSSACRVGLDEHIVNFINQVDHDSYQRPWIRLGDTKFTHQPPERNPRDWVNLTLIHKEPMLTKSDKKNGVLEYSASVPTSLTYNVSCIRFSRWDDD